MAEIIKDSRKPILVAGGGVIYSGATDRLAAFAAVHGIPVVETQAGKGALPLPPFMGFQWLKPRPGKELCLGNMNMP